MAVYKDEKRNTWYFVVRVKQNDGSVKQVKRRGFKKKKDAKEAEAEALLDKTESSDLNFQEAAQNYLEWYEPRRKESSVKVIKNIINNHLKQEFGKKKIIKITPKDVMNYQNKIIGLYSADFLDKIHTTLSAVFNFCIKFHDLSKNPARIAGNFEVEKKKRINFWVLEEFKEFISVVDELIYEAFFMTMYYSGARKGELLALTWKDVIFDNNIIEINKTLDSKRNVTTTKTPSSTRQILMPTFVMDKLRELKKDAAETASVKSSHVVFGHFHDSISTSTLDRRFNKFKKLSGVKSIVMHEFRHSHASYLINKNVGPGVVAERLGHKSVATTLDTYSHLYPNKQFEAVETMEDDFNTEIRRVI